MTDIVQLRLDRLDATPVNEDPFTHVTVTEFVPPSMLRAAVSELPGLKAGGSFPIGSLRLGAAATALFAALEGPEFRSAIARKFGLDLDGAPVMTTLRGWSREKDGRIHTDSETKRVTVLLYLNPETGSWARQEGCLRLLRNADDIEDYAEEIPPVNGTLLVFPNGPTTWHGHKQFVGSRFVIQLNYMTTGRDARHEMRRHRFSAFVKRLTGAAA